MSKRITLVHDDFEAALMLRNTEKLKAVRNLDDRVASLAFDRPASTHNTEQLIAFVPVATAAPFCASLARMYCAPIHDGSDTGGEEYQKCYANNAITDQGAPYYDDKGVLVGRVVQMPCNFRQYNRIRNECRFYGEFFQNTNALNAYIKRNNFLPTDGSDLSELPGNTPPGNGGGNGNGPPPKRNPRPN